MKQIFLALLLAIATPTIATEQPPADYCNDNASWQQWQQLLADNPEDNGIASLYAFRVGLCSMVKSGQIDTVLAIKLFEQMREAVIAGKLEEMDAGRVQL